MPGFTLSSRTRLRRRRGGRRKGEAVITHTEDTDTATTETEAAAAAGEKKTGAVTMIMKRVIYQSSTMVEVSKRRAPTLIAPHCPNRNQSQ